MGRCKLKQLNRTLAEIICNVKELPCTLYEKVSCSCRLSCEPDKLSDSDVEERNQKTGVKDTIDCARPIYTRYPSTMLSVFCVAYLTGGNQYSLKISP